MFLASIFLTYMAIYFAIAAGPALGLMLGLVAVCTFGAAADQGGRPIVRVVKNAKNHKPLDIRKSFTREISREDEGLPSDHFVGYETDLMFRLVDKIVDLGVQCRTMGRVLRTRKH
jgi:hypothetical protein